MSGEVSGIGLEAALGSGYCWGLLDRGAGNPCVGTGSCPLLGLGN